MREASQMKDRYNVLMHLHVSDSAAGWRTENVRAKRVSFVVLFVVAVLTVVGVVWLWPDYAKVDALRAAHSGEQLHHYESGEVLSVGACATGTGSAIVGSGASAGAGVSGTSGGAGAGGGAAGTDASVNSGSNTSGLGSGNASGTGAGVSGASASGRAGASGGDTIGSAISGSATSARVSATSDTSGGTESGSATSAGAGATSGTSGKVRAGAGTASAASAGASGTSGSASAAGGAAGGAGSGGWDAASEPCQLVTVQIRSGVDEGQVFTVSVQGSLALAGLQRGDSVELTAFPAAFTNPASAPASGTATTKTPSTSSAPAASRTPAPAPAESETQGSAPANTQAQGITPTESQAQRSTSATETDPNTNSTTSQSPESASPAPQTQNTTPPDSPSPASTPQSYTSSTLHYQYAISNLNRFSPILVLTALFALILLVIGRLRGLLALAGLAFSCISISVFAFPALLSGRDPVWVGAITSCAIMFVLLYTVHGVRLRTTAALLGTLAGIGLLAFFSQFAIGFMRLTGLHDEVANSLLAATGDLNFHRLFSCAIIIAGLGVLNDVTISQAASVWELAEANPALSRTELFGRAMRIGRNHIASTVYTIFFAFTGAALLTLLLLSIFQKPLVFTLSAEQFSSEIVTTIVSSIALLLTMPLTTWIAVLLTPAQKFAPTMEA